MSTTTEPQPETTRCPACGAVILTSTIECGRCGKTQEREHVFLVALTVTAPVTVTRAEAEVKLHDALPDPHLVDLRGHGVTEWWVAEDDRQDGSDNDSAIFVPKGGQVGETFDLLPESVRATIRAALDDAATYQQGEADEDGDAECFQCGEAGSPCEDHARDLARANAYRDLLDQIGA